MLLQIRAWRYVQSTAAHAPMMAVVLSACPDGKAKPFAPTSAVVADGRGRPTKALAVTVSSDEPTATVVRKATGRQERVRRATHPATARPMTDSATVLPRSVTTRSTAVRSPVRWATSQSSTGRSDEVSSPPSMTPSLRAANTKVAAPATRTPTATTSPSSRRAADASRLRRRTKPVERLRRRMSHHPSTASTATTASTSPARLK